MAQLYLEAISYLCPWYLEAIYYTHSRYPFLRLPNTTQAPGSHIGCPYYRMRTQELLGICLLSFQASLAAQIPPDHILWGPKGPPSTLVPMVSPTPSTSAPALVGERDTVCTNSPISRDCWAGGYNVETDFDRKWPAMSKPVHVRRAASPG